MCARPTFLTLPLYVYYQTVLPVMVRPKLKLKSRIPVSSSEKIRVGRWDFVKLFFKLKSTDVLTSCVIFEVKML